VLSAIKELGAWSLRRDGKEQHNHACFDFKNIQKLGCFEIEKPEHPNIP
jgi:hypothetical protein